MISIVIRTRNEGRNLRKVIKLLKEQTIENEIVIVDSKSEDDTRCICNNEMCCNLVQCKNPFSFGKALNVGIRYSKFNFICILSAHCFPTSKEFLKNMWLNFKDKKVAGVYARQKPHRLTNPIEYRNFLHIYGNEKIIQTANPMFNNGASMIRKDLWKKNHFDENVIAQEDVLWAKDMIKNGYKIIYEPSSVVIHLHNEDVIYTISRYEKETRALVSMGYLEW